MKRKNLLILGMGLLVFILGMGMAQSKRTQNCRTAPYLQIAEEICKVETALKEADGDYAWESISKVTPYTYADPEGNTIVYYCCQTDYVSNEAGDDTGLNLDAIGLVVDLKLMENKRECTVNGYAALLCEIEAETYLCWTLSPEISCVIEYNAEKTMYGDILRMAESVPDPPLRHLP